MEDKLVYLFAAYSIIWAAVLVYAFSLARRQKDLRREIELLRENMKVKEGTVQR